MVAFYPCSTSLYWAVDGDLLVNKCNGDIGLRNESWESVGTIAKDLGYFVDNQLGIGFDRLTRFGW